MSRHSEHAGKSDQASNQTSRHIMLSSHRGAVTELERISLAHGGQYVIRYRRASEASCSVVSDDNPFGPVLWTGFRYHEEHWSFLRKDCPRRNS